MFKYLKKREGSPGQSAEEKFGRDALVEKFVVARELENGKYEYGVYENCFVFWEYLAGVPLLERFYHEVIFGEQPQKLRFDIDAVGEVPQDLLPRILAEIESMFSLLYNIEFDDLFVIYSASSAEKTSYHIIIDKYYVSCSAEAAHFAENVAKVLPQDYLRHIDLGIYGATKNFRLPTCRKRKSERYLEAYEGREYHVENFCVGFIDECESLPNLAPAKENAGVVGEEIVAEDTRIILEIAAKYVAGFQLAPLQFSNENGAVKSTLLTFRRIMPSYCYICGEIHHKDNSALLSISIVGGIGKIYFKCRQMPGRSEYVGEFFSTSRPTEELAKHDEKIPGYQERMNKYFTGLIGRYGAARYEFAGHPTDLKCVYNEPELRPFQLRDTLLVRANMKMGKTKNLMKFIAENFGENAAIVIITPRQTFANEMKKNFADFTLYTDIRGNIPRGKVIVQVESLHRILPDSMPWDLVVIDESESIFGQFDSNLSGDPHHDWVILCYLLQHSRHVIAMDATLEDRTYNVLRRLRADKRKGEMFVHHCTYKNAAEDKYVVTVNKYKWYAAIYEDLAAGKRLVVASSGLRESEILHENLKRRFPALAIGYYSSKTLASVKKKHFSDVGEYWSKYDVLIYTPTVSAGVSYEVVRFDKVYGWFTDQSCNVEICIQMLGRIRNVATKEYCICFDLHGANLPTTVEDIRMSLYRTREALFRKYNLASLEFEYDASGAIKFYENDYFHLWLENTRIANLSRNSFARRFIKYMSTFGAKFDVMDDVEADLVAIKEENDAMRGHLREVEAAAIVAAKDIDLQSLNDLQTKIHSQEDVSAEERAEYERFKLRRDFNFGGDLTLDFALVYNDVGMRRIYRNLRRIKCEDDVNAALARIQAEERDRYIAAIEGCEEKFRNLDIRKKYDFDKHRFAIWCLRQAGWQTIDDPAKLPLVDVFRRLADVADIVYREMAANRDNFSMRLINARNYSRDLPKDKLAKNIIGDINKVLLHMYGVRIAKNKTTYHLLLPPEISIMREDDRKLPNIYDNWQPQYQ